MERSILNLPLPKLCPVLCFRGGEKGEKAPREGNEEGWPRKGAKRKNGRVKTGQDFYTPERGAKRQKGRVKTGQDFYTPAEPGGATLFAG